MKKIIFNMTFARIVSLLIVYCSCIYGLPSPLRQMFPAKVALSQGVNVSSNTKASVDWSNISEGFIAVKYTGGKKCTN